VTCEERPPAQTHRVLDQDRSEHSSLIFKTFFHTFFNKTTDTNSKPAS